MLKPPPKSRKNQQAQQTEDETLRNFQSVQTDVEGQQGERASAVKGEIIEKTVVQSELTQNNTMTNGEEIKSETLMEKISGENDKKAILGEDEEHMKDQGIF